MESEALDAALEWVSVFSSQFLFFLRWVDGNALWNLYSFD